jgi:hypothetical protein
MEQQQQQAGQRGRPPTREEFEKSVAAMHLSNKSLILKAITRVLVLIGWITGSALSIQSHGLTGFMVNSLIFLLFIVIAKR